jgi:hypothetical protein
MQEPTIKLTNQINWLNNGTEALKSDSIIEYQEKHIWKKAVNTSWRPENFDHAQLIATVEEKAWL